MRILIVVATVPEVQGVIFDCKLILQADNIYSGKYQNHDIHLLLTGIGMTNTAYHLGKYLANNRPDLAINMGIAGSFDRNIELGTVVEIVEDSFSEMGAEDNGAFLTLEEMGFPLIQSPKIHYNTFQNTHRSAFPIPKMTAITVNTVHGNASSIEACQNRWNKQIESMETAAFFQIMTEEQLPFYAFRAISNYVEPRNRAAWKIGLAVKNINDFMIHCIKNLDKLL